MESLFSIFVFIFGALIGSFLNVIIFRMNTGKSALRGRSMCMNCGKSLHAHELIPLISYTIQGGKCRGCNSKISVQYPLVELITAIIFSAIFWKFAFLGLFTFSHLIHILYYFVISSILIIIAVYDFRHKIVPDSLSCGLMALTAINLFVSVSATGIILSLPETLTILSGPLLSLPFAILWVASGGRWMGLGDAKLALSLGWILGLSGGISALLLAFWSGGLVGIYLLLSKKKSVTMKSELPFAPFLVFATFLVLFFSIDLGTIAGWFTIQ